MTDKMLIDASHPEETRVVVTRGSRVEEFDFEAADKKQLRGNIYLAKVIRVEPSLQAAFVDYGGNRHGFLAFAEIHPDYYKVSPEDRKALLEEVMRQQRSEDEEAERPQRRSRRNRPDKRRDRKGRERDEAAADAAGDVAATGREPQADVDDASSAAPPAAYDEASPDSAAAQDASAPTVLDETGAPRAVAASARFESDERVASEPVAPEALDAAADAREIAAEPLVELPTGVTVEIDRAPDDEDEDLDDEDDDQNDDQDDDDQDEKDDDASDDEETGDEESEDEEDESGDDGRAAPSAVNQDEIVSGSEEARSDEADEREPVEQIGGDAMDEAPMRAVRTRRQFKIQEVIRRGQILLVQVVKEERGNKGAALTTYLSLAGRYSVLMPNTARGGGISRKITDGDDRKRLKAIAQELEVPEGMGVIVRTAGASRTKQEIRRDFEYLMRMWETVRETTLRSSAPTLVYEEGSLIKRAIRDLYSKDIEEIQVAGQDGYREAKDFMRLLMPTHVKQVKLWADPQPIFARSGVEAQLDGMFSSHVTLKSGGYIVINQTEALVAIDVNSGRSTREHNIEDTALRTNLEAADEVARQLRLRDLAGLIVVDFIDMEESRNNRAVERRMKDALKNDRARIQIGRISHFGLLEMSRQRIRTGVLEGSTVPCPHCMGSGTVRSTASIALHVLRVVEDTLMRNASFDLVVRTRANVALYILNQKRANLLDLELRFGVNIIVKADDSLTGSTYHALERGEPSLGGPAVPRFLARPVEAIEETAEEIEPEIEPEVEDQEAAEAEDAEGEDGADRAEDSEARRRRRRRRRRGRGERGGADGSSVDADGPQPSDEGLGDVAALKGQPLEEDGEDAERPDGETTSADADDGRGRPRRSRRRRARGERREDATDESAERSGSERNGSWSAEPAPLHDVALAESAIEIATPETPSSMPAQASVSEPAPHDASASPAQAASSVDAIPEAADAPVVEAQSETAADPKSQAAEDRRVEELPEAPPPPKRSGWWARAKSSFTGS